MREGRAYDKTCGVSFALNKIVTHRFEKWGMSPQKRKAGSSETLFPETIIIPVMIAHWPGLRDGFSFKSKRANVNRDTLPHASVFCKVDCFHVVRKNELNQETSLVYWP